ncbi:IscS subfamily cysteine desulfurase [Celerinatantimonas yamalensis]|uniref:IscS subfamily cysteine desulfurase n=1 Tax=Celerinatantimonas yamalensis TaxID=559956 RepID=A0ABW9GBE3_9GAMM
MNYLDYAASTPVCTQALELFCELSVNHYANASSLHDAGSEANGVLRYCREQLAVYLEGCADRVFFTGGGTEANIFAIISLAKALPAQRRHILVSQMEHSSVQHAMSMLSEQGFSVSILQPNQYGMVTTERLEAQLRPNTGLVSVQHANSETGIIQPIAMLAKRLRKDGILLHTDAVQTFGKLEVSHAVLGADAITLASHKVYAPKGVGVVSLGPNVAWQPLYPSSSHEGGFRPGTVNVPLIGAFVAACEAIWPSRSADREHTRSLRDRLIAGIEKQSLPIRYFSPSAYDVLPGIFGAFYQGLEGQYVMLTCNRHGVCIATGSACRATEQGLSPALKALGLSHHQGAQYIRISFGRGSTIADIDALLDVLARLAQHQHQR